MTMYLMIWESEDKELLENYKRDVINRKRKAKISEIMEVK